MGFQKEEKPEPVVEEGGAEEGTEDVPDDLDFSLLSKKKKKKKRTGLIDDGEGDSKGWLHLAIINQLYKSVIKKERFMYLKKSHINSKLLLI